MPRLSITVSFSSFSPRLFTPNKVPDGGTTAAMPGGAPVLAAVIRREMSS
ncbi:MAG TPA: hypothetical protein VK815_03865 [Candidatus Acidoferrales bacterium]|nr:hypothetical protein [Candidatus Acidoferrales bacterium]